MTKQNKAEVYRQGDVWLYRMPRGSSSPIIGVRRVPAASDPDKGVILAEGEVTGHHHRIPAEDLKRVFLYPTANAGVRILHVKGKKPVSLVHEEHETLLLPPGEYEVRIQREYDPTTQRRQTYVAD